MAPNMRKDVLKDTPALSLAVLSGTYAIHRLNIRAAVPESVFQSRFFSVTRTDEELSVVCPGELCLDSDRVDPDWACIKVRGPLDFGLTGILADISGVLAVAEISIFAISTFDTDYILVKRASVQTARKALERTGYNFG